MHAELNACMRKLLGACMRKLLSACMRKLLGACADFGCKSMERLGACLTVFACLTTVPCLLDCW